MIIFVGRAICARKTVETPNRERTIEVKRPLAYLCERLVFCHLAIYITLYGKGPLDAHTSSDPQDANP